MTGKKIYIYININIFEIYFFIYFFILFIYLFIFLLLFSGTQLRICVQVATPLNFTCIFKVFQIALVASLLGQFCENFENTREINP